MPVLLRLLAVILLFMGAACALQPPDMSSLYPYREESIGLSDTLRRALVGTSRDAIIYRYGPPSQTAKLDNGMRLMQYNRRRIVSLSSYKGLKVRYNCELRLWIKDHKVADVDYLGDGNDCARFILNARHTVYEDR